jgi:ribosomal protein L34E
MSANESASDPTCRICGRNLLPGERPVAFVTREGQEIQVCELCKERAEAAGWLRPEEVARLHDSGHVPERRRQRGQLLGTLLARTAERRERVSRRPRREAREEVTGEELAGERDEAEAGGTTPERRGGKIERPGAAGPTLEQAIAAFNASKQRRTVAGLNRSLGTARASGLAIRTESGANGARITVAWELSWYQWEIGPGKRGIAIRQARQGSSIDELRAADRTWNLEVADDGALARKDGRGEGRGENSAKGESGEGGTGGRRR